MLSFDLKNIALHFLFIVVHFSRIVWASVSSKRSSTMKDSMSFVCRQKCALILMIFGWLILDKIIFSVQSLICGIWYFLLLVLSLRTQSWKFGKLLAHGNYSHFILSIIKRYLKRWLRWWCEHKWWNNKIWFVYCSSFCNYKTCHLMDNGKYINTKYRLYKLCIIVTFIDDHKLFLFIIATIIVIII